MNIAFRVVLSAVIGGVIYSLGYADGRITERCNQLNGKGAK